jgi:putative membrane protein
MAQHELLMVAAAPLLVLARPLVALLWGLPFAWRCTLGQWSKRTTVQSGWRFWTHPMTAWWIHAAALWLWHIPRFFQATLDNDWIHAAQHVSFLGSALLFWWSLFYAHGRVRYGASVLYLFTTAVHTSILGALLTFASTVWYPAYIATTSAWGVTPLEDQQSGGLIMWIPAGLVYLVAGLVLFAGWLRESERLVTLRECERRGEYAA